MSQGECDKDRSPVGAAKREAERSSRGEQTRRLNGLGLTCTQRFGRRRHWPQQVGSSGCFSKGQVGASTASWEVM